MLDRLGRISHLSMRDVVLVAVVALLAFDRGLPALRALAQDATAEDPPAVMAGTRFSFQGRLLSNGIPETGTFDFQFQVYASAAGNDPVGSQVNAPGVPVEGGLFTVRVDPGSGVFTGDARWVEVRVWMPDKAEYAVVGRQSLDATPYALGLVPGAESIGSVPGGDSVFSAENLDPEGVGVSGTGDIGVYGTSTQTGSPGVFGIGPSIGVAGSSTDGGFGLHGLSFEPTGIGVVGTGGLYGGQLRGSQPGGAGLIARGHVASGAPDIILGGEAGSAASDDGVIVSQPELPGSDIFLISNDAIILQIDADNNEAGNVQVWDHLDNVVFDVDEAGNLEQAAAGFGLPKVVLRTFCGDGGSIASFAQSVPGAAAPTFAGAGDGVCDITFDFNVLNRPVLATGSANALRVATYTITDSDTIRFYRWNVDEDAVTGLMTIAVY